MSLEYGLTQLCATTEIYIQSFIFQFSFHYKKKMRE